MDGVERQVTEPGLRMVLLDENNRFAAESVGGIIDFAHGCRAAQDGIMLIGRGVQVIVRAAQETEVLVETTFERVKLREVPEVRFAKPAGRVTDFLESVADGLFL